MKRSSHQPLDGPHKEFFAGGKLSAQGRFKNGKQVGVWMRYYNNGELWDQGNYDDGKKVGEWKEFNKAGALKQRKVFKAKR